ncbi:unnamed protein product, partial [Leptidea sinapis]
ITLTLQNIVSPLTYCPIRSGILYLWIRYSCEWYFRFNSDIHLSKKKKILITIEIKIICILYVLKIPNINKVKEKHTVTNRSENHFVHTD